jgi:GH25 family lysozyme M1 (1,4-beta-N-acetylmuramidase)
MPITSSSPLRRSLVAGMLAVVVALAPSAQATGDPAPGDGFAGSSGEAAGSTPTARRVQLDVGPTTPGIDVSHWQGEIDWRKVAGAGKRFVFLKATDGHDFLDPTFFRNRTGARSNGLRVGAYHFARPDPSKGDAVEEARGTCCRCWISRRARASTARA